MGSSFCPKCGTPRVGAFRFCRSCQFDFDEIAGGAGAAPPSPIPSSGPDTTPRSYTENAGTTWTATPTTPAAATGRRSPLSPRGVLAIVAVGLAGAVVGLGLLLASGGAGVFGPAAPAATTSAVTAATEQPAVAPTLEPTAMATPGPSPNLFWIYGPFVADPEGGPVIDQQKAYLLDAIKPCPRAGCEDSPTEPEFMFLFNDDPIPALWMPCLSDPEGADCHAALYADLGPAVTPVPSGVITFGNSYDKTTLLIDEPRTKFKRADREICWSANFSEPVGAASLRWILARAGSGGTETLKFREDIDISNPEFDLFANCTNVTYLLDNKAGTYVMRYLRKETVLAEGTFKLVP